MEPNFSRAPAPILILARALRAHGFQLTVVDCDPPDNQRIRVITPQLTVEIVADRGQWSVGFAPVGEDDFFDISVWQACLSGEPVSTDLVPLQIQVDWAIDHLGAERPIRISLPCLRQTRKIRAYRRLGLSHDT